MEQLHDILSKSSWLGGTNTFPKFLHTIHRIAALSINVNWNLSLCSLYP